MAAAVTCAGGGCTLISRGEIFAEQAGHAIIDGVFAAMSAPRQRNKGKEKEDEVRGRNGGRGVRLKKKAFRHARQQKCAHACECQQLLCRANRNIFFFLFPSLCIYMCVLQRRRYIEHEHVTDRHGLLADRAVASAFIKHTNTNTSTTTTTTTGTSETQIAADTAPVVRRSHPASSSSRSRETRAGA